MIKKNILLLICMVLLVGTVMAADYRFQNKTPSDLVVIHGDTGNLTVTGNISTGKTGFFGWLGSLTNRITKLFVVDVDFTGHINGTGNITTTGDITGRDIYTTGNLISDTIHQTSSQGLVLSMSFNNNSVDGLNVLDASGQNNHGTAEGGVNHTSTGGFNGGGAYVFDGVDDLINFGTSVNAGTKSTISFWTNAGTGNVILGEDSYTADYTIYTTGTLLYLRIGANVVSWSGGYIQGTWHHYVITRSGNGTNCTLYVDGVNQGSRIGTGGRLPR